MRNQKGAAMQLAPGVYSMRQQKGGHVHAFLLDDGANLTLIDTLYDTDGALVMEQIRQIGRSAADLKQIVLTHAHRSHLGGLAALKQMSGATVYAHEWEADIIAGDRKAQAISPWPQHPLRVYHLQLGLALGLGRHPPCPVDQMVADGDRIGPLDVLHIPGHSPGHLGFYWADRRVLIAGDAIATWPEFSAGWPAFNLNLKQHRGSLRRLAELDAAVVGVGHGEPITADGASRVRALVDGGG
jgi:glyoxylase-like metal-dependent hydrolase (beta-lactamase superfamily II)